MRHSLRITVGVAVAFVAMLAVLWALRGQASPDVALTSASPRDGAALARPPTQVELAFTAAFDPKLSHVDVQDAAGTSMNAGRLRQVGPDRLSQPVRITAAGDLTVAYHVIFVDGAELTGSLRFSAGAAALADRTAGVDSTAGAGSSGVGTSRVVAEPAHEHGVDPVSATLLAIDGIVALGVVVLLFRRPRPRQPVDPR